MEIYVDLQCFHLIQTQEFREQLVPISHGIVNNPRF